MNVEVWAPLAKSVEVVAGGRRFALSPAQARGYWRGEVPGELLLQGYRFSLDGGAELPDPRSRWQPQGVHGPSFPAEGVPLQPSAGTPAQVPAPELRGTTFTRSTQLRDAVIYELHVGTFTPQGTYAAAGSKLAHLKALGVTHLEILPLATFPGRHGWGYDGVDLYAPHPAYGTPRDLAEFVADCHREGLHVLLDVVYNHLGPDGNYLGQFGSYFTDHYKTGWGSAVNYDGPDSDEVRRFVIDNALMWLGDYGFDGLRLDAVHAIFSFGAVHVLEDLALAAKALGRATGRDYVLIAETDLNDPRFVLPPAKGGFGLDAQWSDDFHHAIHAYFTREISGYYEDFGSLADVASALQFGYVFRGQYSPFRRRRHGRPPSGVAADQLVVFAQNHDQIGNRAQGERLSMMVDPARLKAIAALTLLSPFTPLLFQGEEWGAATPFQYFTDHENAELGRLVAEGRAREFASFSWQGEVPNPQDAATFERSRLDWAELEKPVHRDLCGWHRQLIHLRHERTRGGLSAAKASVKFNEKAGWLWFVCGGVLVQLNLSDRAQRVPRPKGDWGRVMSSTAGAEAATAHSPVTGSDEQMPAGATWISRLAG